VDEVCEEPSHWSLAQTLGDWLAQEGVTGLAGVDTRALTQHIRASGTMLAKILVDDDASSDQLAWVDPAKLNLVADVSTAKEFTINPGGQPRIRAVDCGLKYNQLRCLARRGARVDVVPWDTPLDDIGHYDGLFLSNGPGDPAV